MSTTKQIEANRANSRHSTGPWTVEGKIVASKNSLKHGIFCHDLIISGESLEELELLRRQIESWIPPRNACESLLVAELVACAWRLRRMRKIESQVFNDFVTATNKSTAEAFLWRGKYFELLARYEKNIKNDFYRVLDRLGRGPILGELRTILEEQEIVTTEVERRKGIRIPWLFHDLNGEPFAKKYERGGNHRAIF